MQNVSTTSLLSNSQSLGTYYEKNESSFCPSASKEPDCRFHALHLQICLAIPTSLLSTAFAQWPISAVPYVPLPGVGTTALLPDGVLVTLVLCRWWSTSLIWCWSFICMHQCFSQFVCQLTKCKHLVAWQSKLNTVFQEINAPSNFKAVFKNSR